MASMILLNIKKCHIADWYSDIRHSINLHPYHANDALIAKGNIIEGVEAKY